MITIHTADQCQFEVPNHVAHLIDFVRACTDETDGDEDVVLPKVNAREFSKIIEFCNIHTSDPVNRLEVPLRSNDLQSLVGERVFAFVQSIDVKHELVDLILAVDYLGQEQLMAVLCAHMAILANTSDNVDAFLARFDPVAMTV